jgi:hypothetical protein
MKLEPVNQTREDVLAELWAWASPSPWRRFRLWLFLAWGVCWHGEGFCSGHCW